jgi:hypothetical protein
MTDTNTFEKLGRDHALEAIDQIGARGYRDAQDVRDSYEENLGYTLAEAFPSATTNQIAIAYDAFRATWASKSEAAQ